MREIDSNRSYFFNSIIKIAERKPIAFQALCYQLSTFSMSISSFVLLTEIEEIRI